MSHCESHLSPLLDSELLHRDFSAWQYIAKYTSTTQIAESYCIQQISSYTRTESTAMKICSDANAYIVGMKTLAATSGKVHTALDNQRAASLSVTFSHNAKAYAVTAFCTNTIIKFKPADCVKWGTKFSERVTSTNTADVLFFCTTIILLLDATTVSNTFTTHLTHRRSSSVNTSSSAAPWPIATAKFFTTAEITKLEFKIEPSNNSSLLLSFFRLEVLWCRPDEY